MKRREFIRTGLSASGGVFVALTGCKTLDDSLAPIESSPESYRTIYFRVEGDNRFYLTFDRVEMGQGIITGFATLFGEEADIRPSALNMVPAHTDKRFGNMSWW